MKTGLFSTAFLSLFLAASLPAKEANWTGNYTDKKYLNGQAVFQLNVLQEGEAITVDFDAVYNDGHGCAPQGNGPAKIVDENTPVHFHRHRRQRRDRHDQARGRRSDHFDQTNPRRRSTLHRFLPGRHPAKAGALAPMWEGPDATPLGGNGRPALAGVR